MTAGDMWDFSMGLYGTPGDMWDYHMGLWGICGTTTWDCRGYVGPPHITAGDMWDYHI